MDDGMLNLIITAAGTATLILLEMQDFGLSVCLRVCLILGTKSALGPENG